MTARTTRILNRFASQGAVNQHGGSLALYRCNTCQAEVVWAESTRTGRRYLANARHGQAGQAYYVGSDIHRCEPVESAPVVDNAARLAIVQTQLDSVRTLLADASAANNAGSVLRLVEMLDKLVGEKHRLQHA